MLTDGTAVLIWCELAAAFIFGVAWLALRNAQKAALVASLMMCLLFCFRMFHMGVNSIAEKIIGSTPDGLVSLVLFGLLCAILISSILKNEWNFGKLSFKVDSARFTHALNIASTLLVILNTVPLLITQAQLSSDDAETVARLQKPMRDVSPAPNAQKPDIYYIIFDANAHPETLLSLWNYDNKEFIDFLKSKGFYVVEKATSNYDRTLLSLSSTFNMEYLDSVRDKLGKDWSPATVFCRLIQDNSFWHVLKKSGYKWINFASGFTADDEIPEAKNIHATYGNNFNVLLLMMTPLEVTDTYVPILRDLFADAYVAPDKYLKDVVAEKGPKFVYIHCNLPHPPFCFDEHGNRLPLDLISNTKYSKPEAYLQQLKFAEIEARKWINTILDRPGPPPVIIVQSDHGPLFQSENFKAHVNQRMRILNAIYFPGKNNKGLYPTVTPVNTFRILLNNYFGTDLPMLPDKSFHSRSEEFGLRYEDVTSLVEFGK